MIHSDVEERGADKDTSKAIAAFSYAYRVGVSANHIFSR
jgi:hypothetical protein